MSSDFTRIKNLHNFGSSPDTNLLILTGISGSGKTTTSSRLKSHYAPADVIHLDAYFGTMPDSLQSKGFNAYMSTHRPLQTDWPLSIIRLIFDYARAAYGTKRIIAEGLHWIDPVVKEDEDIWDTIKGRKIPIVVCECDIETASRRSCNKDAIDEAFQQIWKQNILELLED